VFENRVLGRIFGLKRGEITRGWRKLHNEELHNLYFSPSIIRMINDEMGRACSKRGGENECIKDFCGKSRRKENIRMT
jgi:hypothetical protein